MKFETISTTNTLRTNETNETNKEELENQQFERNKDHYGEDLAKKIEANPELTKKLEPLLQAYIKEDTALWDTQSF